MPSKTETISEPEPRTLADNSIEPTTSRRCSIDMIRSEISTGKLLLQKQESLISERIELARNIEPETRTSPLLVDDTVVTENQVPNKVLPGIKLSDSNSNQDIESQVMGKTSVSFSKSSE